MLILHHIIIITCSFLTVQFFWSSDSVIYNDKNQTSILSKHLQEFYSHFCQNLLSQSVWHVSHKKSSFCVFHSHSDWVQISRFNIFEDNVKTSEEKDSQRQYFSVYVQLTCLKLIKNVQLLQLIKLNNLNNKIHSQSTWEE